MCCQDPHTSRLHTFQNTPHAHQLSICTVPELQQGFVSTEHMVITNFTENHRSNTAFPWEQIRHDVYIQDTQRSISAQDHSPLRAGLGMSGQKIRHLRRILRTAPVSRHLLSAPGADSHFLDMHISHHPLEKCYWHCLAPKEHDCWFHQLQPGTQRKAKVFRIPWTMALSQILLQNRKHWWISSIARSASTYRGIFPASERSTCKPKWGGRRRGGDWCYTNIIAACIHFQA